jgi:hypothetical protein
MVLYQPVCYGKSSAVVRVVKRSKIFLLVAGIILAAFFALILLLPEPKPDPLPTPNGYDDFMAAEGMVTNIIPDKDSGTLTEFRAFVSSSRPALERGRLGLTKECRVPTEYSIKWVANHDLCMATEKLAGTFCAEGILAKMEGRPSDAAGCFMDAIKLGSVVARGGLEIDALIATDCERQGESMFESIITNLDLEQSRKYMAALDKVEGEHEPPDEIMDRENRLLRAQLRSINGIKSFAYMCIERRSLNWRAKMRRDFLKVCNRRLEREQQTKGKLAIHSFKLEKGRYPTNWDELVRSDLKGVPDKPFTEWITNRLKYTSDTKSP